MLRQFRSLQTIMYHLPGSSVLFEYGARALIYLHPGEYIKSMRDIFVLRFNVRSAYVYYRMGSYMGNREEVYIYIYIYIYMYCI